MTINELALQAIEAMEKSGYADYNAMSDYRDIFLPIIRFHEKCGFDEFNPDVMAKYVEILNIRVENMEIASKRRNRLMYGVRRLTEFHDKGKLQWTFSKSNYFILNEYYLL